MSSAVCMYVWYTRSIMYDPEQITFFAKTDARGQQVPFGIKAKDRTRHMYIVGKTGMGKSTLLENMAVQDIKNGNGLAFIDPHGQTAETLLDYIPEERKNDVVYFAPFDTDYPISFNIMEDVGADKRHLVVSGLMSVFKKIWVDAWSARMEYILSNTLLALLEYPDSTLLGVNRMLSDKEYRMRVIENITDPAVKSFWVDEFLKYNERYMQEAGDAIKNKIGQFSSNPLIRNIIGQPHSSFDIREIMDQRKILIMNLSKGLVGEQNANLLGSMLTTRIYLAAMSRADNTPAQMEAAPNFYFYVDEFQSFANATFADILSEARKYKLNLTIAHQYIEQMEEEVRNAVFGNVGTIISFRVGPFDAEVLETIFTPKFLAPDIVNLGFAQIYLTLMIDGIGSQPFSATTLPPIELSGVSCRDIVIAHSRKNYTKPRAVTEEKIHEWHAKNFSNKPPYIPKHLREIADGGTLPNTGENLKKYGKEGSPKQESQTGQNKNEFASPAKKDTRTSFQKNTTQTHRNAPSSANGSVQSNRKPMEPRRANVQNKNNASNNTKNTRQSNNEGGAPSTMKEGAQQTHPKEKSTEDLRAILKKISKEDGAQEKKTSEKITGKSSARTNTNDTPSLKDALKMALGDLPSNETPGRADTSHAHTTVAGKEREKKGTSVSSQTLPSSKKVYQQKKTEKQNNPTPEKNTGGLDTPDNAHIQQNDTHRGDENSTAPVSIQIKKEQQEYAQMKNIDDPLAPKKLEKMMRVTTSDKPPIK